MQMFRQSNLSGLVAVIVGAISLMSVPAAMAAAGTYDPGATPAVLSTDTVDNSDLAGPSDVTAPDTVMMTLHRPDDVGRGLALGATSAGGNQSLEPSADLMMGDQPDPGDIDLNG